MEDRIKEAGLRSHVVDYHLCVYSKPLGKSMLLDSKEAFIWMWLKEDGGGQELVDQFSVAFDCSRCEAAQTIYEALKRWKREMAVVRKER